MDEKSILSRELVPVLLGLSHATRRTARRLLRQYGVLSHVFCDRPAYALRALSLSMKIHTVPHTADERLLLTALEDFAGQARSTDVILYLVPCTDAAVAFVKRHREVLESRFILAKRSARAPHTFGLALPLRHAERSRPHES